MMGSARMPLPQGTYVTHASVIRIYSIVSILQDTIGTSQFGASVGFS
jgi:hypothetical protein